MFFKLILSSEEGKIILANHNVIKLIIFFVVHLEFPFLIPNSQDKCTKMCSVHICFQAFGVKGQNCTKNIFSVNGLPDILQFKMNV